MSAQHTPGPWSVSLGGHGQAWGGYWQIDAEHDAVACNQFCFANRTSEVSAANASLIAAAPELLEALEDAIEIIDDQLCGDFPESLAHFKSVVAKALGQ